MTWHDSNPMISIMMQLQVWSRWSMEWLSWAHCFQPWILSTWDLPWPLGSLASLASLYFLSPETKWHVMGHRWYVGIYGHIDEISWNRIKYHELWWHMGFFFGTAGYLGSWWKLFVVGMAVTKRVVGQPKQGAVVCLLRRGSRTLFLAKSKPL